MLKIKFLLPLLLVISALVWWLMPHYSDEDKAYYIATFCTLTHDGRDNSAQAMQQIIEGGNSDYALQKIHFQSGLAEHLQTVWQDLSPQQQQQARQDAAETRQRLQAVVDASDRLVGMITVDDIVHIIQQEAGEDALRLSGAGEGDINEPIRFTVRTRIAWLVVNLGATMLSASVVGLFQGEIARFALLAALMPIVSALGGNAGTQTLAVVVRALATNQLTSSNTLRMLAREFQIALCNGGALGLVGAVELAPRRDAPGSRGYEVYRRCFHDGRLLVRCTGDIIALSPPLIVDKAQIDQITGTLGEMIRATA